MLGFPGGARSGQDAVSPAKRVRGNLSQKSVIRAHEGPLVEGGYLSLKNRRKRDRRGRIEHESASRGHYLSSLNPFDSGKQSSRRRGIAGPVIIICAIIVVLVAADFWLNSGKIHRGVEVGSVSLGGKTPAEAREIVRDQAMGPLEDIDFDGPAHFSRKAGEMGVSLRHR